jgi:hypothetical protein
MADLACVDSALLLVRGDVNASIGLDLAGKPRRTPRSHNSPTVLQSASTVRCDSGSDTARFDYMQSGDREIYLYERSCLHLHGRKVRQ